MGYLMKNKKKDMQQIEQSVFSNYIRLIGIILLKIIQCDYVTFTH